MRPVAFMLRTGISAGALAFSGLAAAQTASPPNEDQAVASEAPEIVVTGIRGSLQQSLDLKRSAAAVVDAISAEDVGKFPDVNIAESVQRITGVQINRTRGEGRTVNIRGLPSNFTLTTLNGRSIANAISNGNAASSRSFDFSILPSEFIRTLEVYKSPTADLDDGGLAGVVNIKTPRPFDIGKFALSGSAQGDWESNTGTVRPRVSAFFSDVTADGRFGVAIGLAYVRRSPETHQAGAPNFTTATEASGIPTGSGPDDLNGNGIIEPTLRVRLPVGTPFSIQAEDTKRTSGLLSLQWRPIDAVTLYADAFYSKVDVEVVANEHLHIWNNAPTVVPSGVSVSLLEGLPTTTRFQVRGLDLRGGGRFEDRKGDLGAYTLGVSLEKGLWFGRFEGSISRSGQTRDNLNIATIANGNAALAVDIGSEVPSVTYLDGFDQSRLLPTSFRVASLNGEFQRRSQNTIKDLTLDLGRKFDDGGFLKALRIGAKFVDAKVFQDNGVLNLTAAQVSTLAGGLPAGPTAGSFSAAPFMVLAQASRGEYLGAYDGGATIPTSWLVSDTRTFTRRFTTDQLRAAGTFTNDDTGITNVKEQTLAAYVRADVGVGRLSGNLGLRIVKTWQQTVGVSPDLTGITVASDAGNVTRVPAAGAISVRRSYVDYLPSLNLKWEPTDNLVFRFGASRTVTRPNLADISPTTVANGVQLTITRRDPFLDPFRANNLDLTGEWYFARGSVLGASLFYKDLKSLIRTKVETLTLPVTFIRTSGNTGGTLDFSVSSLVNGAGVTVKGIEAYYQQNFTFLPGPLNGLGALVNFTYIDNSDPLQLTAASKYNYNATAFYEKGPLGVRVSYTWRDGFLLLAQQGFAMGQETRAFGSLDASVNFKVARFLSLVVEGSNLTDSPERVRYTTGIPNTFIDFGHRILFGARVSF